jgi:hypothetical protein
VQKASSQKRQSRILAGHADAQASRGNEGTQFTCFTSTKVQILTPEKQGLETALAQMESEIQDKDQRIRMLSAEAEQQSQLLLAQGAEERRRFDI